MAKHYDTAALRADMERTFAELRDQALPLCRNSDDAAFMAVQMRLHPLVIDIAVAELDGRNKGQSQYFGRALGLMLGQALHGLRSTDFEQFLIAVGTMTQVMNGIRPDAAVLGGVDAVSVEGGHA